MVLVLFLVTFFASGAVAVVYKFTEGPIAEAKAAKTGSAIGEVVPAFDNDIAATVQLIEQDGGTVKMYTAEKDGSPVGYAVESFTNNGFSGLISIMVGFLPDGTINGIQVLQHAETPGLGSKMTEPGNVLTASFEGKNPADLKMSVKKDGGDVDALTASTITSRAYAEAVQQAYDVFQAEVRGEAAPQKEALDPYKIVFPGYDNDPKAEEKVFKNDIEPAILVSPVRKGGELMGHLVYSVSNGFNGPIELFVGFAPDGTILDVLVAGQRETTSWGSDMEQADNVLLGSFKGKKADELNMSLKANGGDIDAISGSTVSSEAYTKAVAQAWRAVKTITE